MSIAILRELRRRRIFEAGPGKEEHERLAQELGYIWGRPHTDLRLFEFSSASRHVHFRGLLPWADVKEGAMRLPTACAVGYRSIVGFADWQNFNSIVTRSKAHDYGAMQQLMAERGAARGEEFTDENRYWLRSCRIHL